MSTIEINGAPLGTPLQELLMSDSIEPGSAVSYQLCKTIYTYHPLGRKMAETPIELAQSQEREITFQRGPEDRLREAFRAEWQKLSANRHILNAHALARVYGISALALKCEEVADDRPINYKNLYKYSISFNTLDPLNTAGSLVLNQEPNAMDFQHVTSVWVQGKKYHPSRTRVVMNERPIYIEYSVSAFGYVGRSVYQRALYPMKTFIETMVTDNMVAKKAGLIIAMMEQAGSIIDGMMAAVGAIKRNLLKIAVTGNVLEVGKDDKIESINLQNLEGPATMARKNAIENVATAAGMPAKLLLQESFAEGFGEGTEDAKYVAKFIDLTRAEVQPLYEFFDEIVMHRAFNPEFYELIQRDFPDDYADVDYDAAFYSWKNSFSWKWPSLITEPDSEKIKVDDVKLKAVITWVTTLIPHLDPVNKVLLIQWACDNFNELKLMFGSQLQLDYEALESYVPPAPATGVGDEQAVSDALRGLSDAVARLPSRPRRSLPSPELRKVS